MLFQPNRQSLRKLTLNSTNVTLPISKSLKRKSTPLAIKVKQSKDLHKEHTYTLFILHTNLSSLASPQQSPLVTSFVGQNKSVLNINIMLRKKTSFNPYRRIDRSSLYRKYSRFLHVCSNRYLGLEFLFWI